MEPNNQTPTSTAPEEIQSQQPGATNDPGMALAIAGLILCFVATPVGLVLCLLARSKSKKAGFNNGLALAGIIISTVLIAIVVLAILASLVLSTIANVQQNA